MRFLINVFIFMVVLNSMTYAEEIPGSGSADSRIRTSVYNPDEVYRVAARIGYASYLQFWEGEKLESYFTGDVGGWDVGSHGSVLALKPLVKNPTTNFIIVTNKGRVYNVIFDLKTKVTKGHVIGLRFRYPDQEREKHQQQKTAEQQANELEQVKAARLLADEFELKQEKAAQKREAIKAKAEREKKLARLENDLRRRALKQEQNEEQLALLSLQEQFFGFEQRKKQAAYDERKRQRDEVMEIARQKQEALELAQSRIDAARIRHKRAALEAEQEADAAREREEKRLSRAKKQAAADPDQQPYKNYKYLASGTGELRPLDMFDNGRFTFIRFAEDIQLPAVFRVRNGQETLVNSSMKDGWMVIQSLSAEWKVRLDDELICIKKSGRG